MEVDANRLHLERQVPRQGRHRPAVERPDERHPRRCVAAACAAHEEQGASRANLFCGVASDLQRQQEMGFDIPARLVKVELC